MHKEDITIRSFDGLTMAPVAQRPWKTALYNATEAEFGKEGLGPRIPYTFEPAPPPTPTNNTKTTSRISYGVPPPARARRMTIPEPIIEETNEGENLAPVSILRQQAFAAEEASTASKASADMELLKPPRGEDRREEKDLEQGLKRSRGR